MNAFRNSYFSRGASILMTLSFLLFSLHPTTTYAISTGPGQPELEGFSPLGADEMVDLFSGDFSYNLPLLQVPGPGGGYPINLSYAAGAQMEQEASWVGLGWSLNPGAVNREIRGLPDDFNGQQVNKKLHQKPNRTFGANIALANLETFGADAKKLGLNLSANVNLFYNNYRGFAVQPGLGFSLVDAQDRRSANAAAPDEAIDSNGKAGAGPSFPFKIKMNEVRPEKKSIFANPVHSFGSHYKNLWKRTKRNPGGLFSSSVAPSVSDVNYTFPMKSSSYTLNVKTGIEVAGVSGDIQVNAYFSELAVDDEDVNVPAYGYLYSEHNHGGGSGLMDFTLDNQSMLTPDSRILPMPNHTYDVFHVKSQGVNGTVRAYKGGVSKLVDPSVRSGKKNIGGGFELNSLGIFNKVGVNLNGGGGSSYTGPWKDGDGSVGFLSTNLEQLRVAAPDFEPFHFKFANELTAEANTQTIHRDEKPARFDLAAQPGLLASKPKLLPSLQGSSISTMSAANAYRTERETRAKSFVALSEAEAAAYDGYTRTVGEVLSPSTPVSINFETSAGPEKDRIGALHVTDEQGLRYVYGIPAKNTMQKQTTFSTAAVYGSAIADLIAKSKSYVATENSLSNSSGTDNFYSATQTPEHAHSYLLTEVLSEDYVDINVNGPDREDFGTYTKFGYVVKQGFRSKSPATGADYLPGHLSNSGDDKGMITYFEKDLYYLRSVETKTHVAIFEVEARTDAQGVTGENGAPSSSENQYRLKKISLYHVEDYEENGSSAKPVKTVHFGYSYDLCAGAPNASSGKLTLEKVWYTVGTQKTRASLSPYEFTYGNNYGYDDMQMDRWATYQDAAGNEFGSNLLYPYTVQEKALADEYAAAWSLQEIKLPTGGTISISYEADDYKYVQNRPAQRMYEIVGFASSPTGVAGNALDNNTRWMIIEVPEVVNSQQQASKYLQGVDQLYFKVFMKMKKFGRTDLAPSDTTPFNQGGVAYDFVEGYAKLTTGIPSMYQGGGNKRIALEIEPQSSGSYHPVKKAGWMDLRVSRSDLLDDSSISLNGFSNFSASLLGTIGSITSKAIKFMMDEGSFFPMAEIKGWCDQMDNSSGLKSVVRLNAPGKKIGGGHRVKHISISDEWSEMGGASQESYGQSYHYVLPDGSSSGVAQYEPLTGGEENPFREPIRYSTDKLIIKDNDLFAQLPVGESFFPAAFVGYSRVVVRNNANDVVTQGGAGVRVSEFYTAKDYPVQSDRTDMHKVNTDLLERLVLFIGNKKYFQPGFSQGYSMELNNMHGQRKSEATYAAHANLSRATPVQKTEYHYRTEGGYMPGKVNRLNNKVEVFEADGTQSRKAVGISQDTHLYLSESSENAVSGAVDGNIDAALFVAVPTAWPTIDYSYTLTRLAVLAKVTSKTGILEKVVHTYSGAETVTENLAYDAETGTAILSTVTNDYNDTISSFTNLAKWEYPEMGGAYRNTGVVIEGPVANYLGYLLPGDMLINATTQERAWVTENAGSLVVRRKDGTQVLIADLQGYKVVKSGYSNKLSTSMGSIEAMGDPYNLIGSSGSLNGVLNATAVEYEDQLKTTMDISAHLSSSDTAGMGLNPYAYAMKGIYKPYKNYVFIEDRAQTTAGEDYDFHTNIKNDGGYKQFSTYSPGSSNPGWSMMSEVSLYDHNGLAVEEQDALGNYSAVLYGYGRNLPVSVSQNAQYTEMAYDGFEDHQLGTFVAPTFDAANKSSHFQFGKAFSLSRPYDAHTGMYSLVVREDQPKISLDASLDLIAGKQYLLQAWRKTGAGGSLKVSVDGSSVTAAPVSRDIEGWELVELVFTAGKEHLLGVLGDGAQFDDIKLHPLDAGFKAFVYDRYNHKLIAALDENHFATIYNYDKDGGLVQVKKETEYGYRTIQSTQRSTSRGMITYEPPAE